MRRKTWQPELEAKIHRLDSPQPEAMAPAVSLDDYIVAGRRKMTATRLRALAKLTRQIAAKMGTEQARPHPDLCHYTGKLIRLLESDRVKRCQDPLDGALAEAGVAAEYLLKGMDAIPDHVPEIGLTDDAGVVSRVFARNPELMRIP